MIVSGFQRFLVGSTAASDASLFFHSPVIYRINGIRGILTLLFITMTGKPNKAGSSLACHLRELGSVPNIPATSAAVTKSFLQFLSSSSVTFITPSIPLCACFPYAL